MKIKKLVLIPVVALVASSAFAEKYSTNNSPPKPNADNTELNRRDVAVNSNTLTPPDQSRGSKADVEITRRIRELVVKDDSLSSKAHNVKIITLRGIATLRGPVESSEERSKIVSFAKQVTGGNRFVHNQLEVKSEN